jgi:hypothetical protein
LVKESEPEIPISVIENIFFLLRCLAESKLSEETVNNACIYINAGLRVLTKLVGFEFPEPVWAVTSHLAVSLLLLEGTVFDLILREILNLLIVLIENQRFDKPAFEIDFELIFLKISRAIQSDQIVLSRLTCALLKNKLTPEPDLRIYLIGYLPAMIASPRKDVIAPVINALAERFEALESPAVAPALLTFLANTAASPVPHLTTLFSQFNDADFLMKAARFFSTL